MRTPRFIVVAGPPCSGKSVLAGVLAARLQLVHLEMDRFRTRVLPGSDQRVEHRDIAYRAMHYAAELLAAECARAVVLDATYTAAECRQGMIDIVERIGGPLFLIECHVEPHVAVERFAQRHHHPAVDLTPSRVDHLAREYPYSPQAWPALSSGHDDLALAEILEHLERRALSSAARLDWCRRGQPREHADMTKLAAATSWSAAGHSFDNSR
jgi:predicted kinase